MNNYEAVNSEYINNSVGNKNCYLIFAAEYNEDVMYGRLVQRCKNSIDLAWAYDCELCYECTDCRKCFNCLFCERSQDSSDLVFCFALRDSKNCILCTNLHHAQYCIENKQCTKEEYEKRKAEILASHESVEVAKRRFEELKVRAIVKFSFQTKCEDSTGDYLFNSHNSKRMFDSSDAKDCAFSADAEMPIDSYDLNNAYYKPEYCLDVMGALTIQRGRFSTYVFNCSDIEYSDNLHNCNSCFGCIGMKKCDYYILNKQYTPEKYREARAQIVESMKAERLYGQFFTPSLSPFGYNETLAKDYFPLSPAEALHQGFKWQKETTGTYGKETVKRGAIPSGSVDRLDDKIASEVLACDKCGLNFRITPQEFQFYFYFTISQ